MSTHTNQPLSVMFLEELAAAEAQVLAALEDANEKAGKLRAQQKRAGHLRRAIEELDAYRAASGES